jgi:hypothetical protein
MNDAVYGALMERLGGNSISASETDPLAQALLAQLGEDDPRARMIALWLAQRKAVQAREPPLQVIDQLAQHDEGEQENDAQAMDAIDAEPATDHFERLRQMVDRMGAELQELRERNDAAAAALGACYLCWGVSARCVICTGRGQSGWLPPHAALYEQLVAPAVRHLQHRDALGIAQVNAGDAIGRRQHTSANARREP